MCATPSRLLHTPTNSDRWVWTNGGVVIRWGKSADQPASAQLRPPQISKSPGNEAAGSWTLTLYATIRPAFVLFRPQEIDAAIPKVCIYGCIVFTTKLSTGPWRLVTERRYSFTILDFDIRRRSEVRGHRWRPLNPQEEIPWYPFGEPQSLSGQYGEEKNPWAYRESNPDLPVRSPLLYWTISYSKTYDITTFKHGAIQIFEYRTRNH
jgi:hypothetical protein